MREETTQENTQVEATTIDETTGETTETSYLDGKYKSVSDLESGYKELQASYSKKLGGFDGAPEQYTRPESVQEGDQTFEFVSKWGAENQLSDKGLSSLIEGYNEHMQTQQEAYQKEQLKALGDNAEERIKNAADWVKGNLGEDYMEALNSTFVGAKGIEAIEKLKEMTTQSTPTQAPVATAPDRETLQAMRFAKDEFGNRKMSVDPKYRAKVIALEEQLLGRG